MQRLLIHMTLAIALVLCCDGWLTSLPHAAAEQGGERRRSVENTTVSFGAWQSDPPLDRFPVESPGPRNRHEVFPHKVRIQSGSAITFLIGGFHQVIVYDAGTRPDDVDADSTILSTGAPNDAELFDDDKNRIYRGPDPSRFQLVDPLDNAKRIAVRDRLEVVHFPKPGTYLVICGIRGHFVNDAMFGFVKVLR
jgi:hypothetical protein